MIMPASSCKYRTVIRWIRSCGPLFETLYYPNELVSGSMQEECLQQPYVELMLDSISYSYQMVVCMP